MPDGPAVAAAPTAEWTTPQSGPKFLPRTRAQPKGKRAEMWQHGERKGGGRPCRACKIRILHNQIVSSLERRDIAQYIHFLQYHHLHTNNLESVIRVSSLAAKTVSRMQTLIGLSSVPYSVWKKGPNKATACRNLFTNRNQCGSSARIGDDATACDRANAESCLKTPRRKSSLRAYAPQVGTCRPGAWTALVLQYRISAGAQGGSRTHTPLLAGDFESPASTIPPLGPRGCSSEAARPRQHARTQNITPTNHSVIAGKLTRTTTRTRSEITKGATPR